MADSQDWPVTLKNLDTGETLELPGVYQYMTIGQSVIIDSAKAEGASGRLKQAQGFDDLHVNLTVLLPDLGQTNGADNNLVELRKINDAFKATTSSGTPSRFEIVSLHTYVRGVKEVIWSDLSSDEGWEKNTIRVDLTFTQIVQSNQQSDGGGGDTPTTNPTDAGSGTGSTGQLQIPDGYGRGPIGL